MVKFGYKLMSEEHGPRELVENAVRAEAAGFDFVSISDHYHPWLEAQGHASFAWSVLGALAHATSTIDIATGLTCPIIRYHPAIIAQAAATIAVMSENRFTLALGAGERLNEHVAGDRWPSVPERHRMLGEAVDILRALWSGEVTTLQTEHYRIDYARLYDLPDREIPIAIGVSGPKSTALAAEKADALMATEPKAELVKQFRAAKGQEAAAYAEVTLAYGPTEEAALKIAHERFRFAATGWKVMSELPSVEAFEAATSLVRPEDLKDKFGIGPDVESHVAAVRKYQDAGFDHLVLTAPGPDQEGFIRFFETELRPALMG